MTGVQTWALPIFHAGQHVLISGTILTARDAAHKRLIECIDAKREADLPIDLDGQILYYVGPTPPRPGAAIGSAGPTTASRMDPYAPKLIQRGLRGMIGKGYRGQAVRDALASFGCVNFSAFGGLGALLSQCVTAAEVIAYDDLGTEAIRRLTVIDMPVIVSYDTHGRSVYDDAADRYRRPTPGLSL